MDIVLGHALLNIIESIVILMIFTSVNNLNGFIRKNLLKSTIFVFMYTLIVTLSDRIIPQGIKLAFIIVFVSLIFSFMMQIRLIPTFIINAIIYMFFFTIEIFVLLIFAAILHTNMETISDTSPTIIFCGIIAKVLEVFLALLFSKSSIRIKWLGEFKKTNTLFELLALQTFMIVIIILSLLYVTTYSANIMLYNIFIVIIYLLFLALNIIDYKERERLNAVQNRFKVQDEYIKNMENIVNIIRREKHDFSNHLNTILAMCTLNKPDTVPKIGNYIKKLSVKLIDTYHFFNTGNDYVDGMLAVKSNIAFERGIELDADFYAPLKNLDIGDCDITSIIGNITDNALEAITSAGDTEGKKVSIRTYEDHKDYCISICNNGPAIAEKDISKIFSSGFSTKRSEKSDHGFGLYIVQQLIQRYNGMITVSSIEEKTEFLIRFVKDGKMDGKAG